MKNSYVILALALVFSSILVAQEMKKNTGDIQSGPTEYGRAHFLGVVPSLVKQMEEGTIIYGSSKIGIINDKKNLKPKSWSSPGASDAPQERAAASIRQATAPGDHTRAPIIDFEAHQVTTFAPSDPTPYQLISRHPL